MSFANEVKKELLSLEDVATCCKKAMVLGILQGGCNIVFYNGGIKLVIKSHLIAAIQKTMTILKNDYKIEATIKYGNDDNINRIRYYYLEIVGDVESIIDDYALSPFSELSIKHKLIKNECCKNAFVRGMYSIKGSINDPRKNCYHFEITCKTHELALLLKDIFVSNQIEAKIRERKTGYVVYIKKSEDISSSLALLGASSGVFYFEDSRIVRDISNMANRMANCDIANVKKSTDTAQKQLRAIEYIKKTGYFYKMSLRLQTIATMREDYPDATLEELSEFSDKVFGKRLSKSGISHCLKALMNQYEEILKENNNKKTKN